MGAERSFPHRPFAVIVLLLWVIESKHRSDPYVIPIVGIVTFAFKELDHLQFTWNMLPWPLALIPSAIPSLSPDGINYLHWIMDMLSPPSPSGGGFPTPTLRSGYR